MLVGSPFDMGSAGDGGWLGEIAGTARSLFQMQMDKKRRRQAQKGGPTFGAMSYAGQQSQLPGWLGGGMEPADSMMGSMFGNAPSSRDFPGCFTVSQPGQGRVTPCRTINAVGPNGQHYEWVYRGRPVLYSGDIAIQKRVNKLLKTRGRSVARRTKRCR